VKREHFDRFRFLLCGVFLLATLPPGCRRGSQPLASALASVPEAEQRAAEAVRVDHAPKLDGTLDDPLWQSAKPITDFRQKEPHEGEPVTEKTEVRILYTRSAVYFGIHCYDSEPSRIVATELRRDVSQDLDDHFEILIDSNHNRRGGYVFEINPLGTQSDGLIVEEQGRRTEAISTGDGTEYGRPRLASPLTDGSQQ
jgi:hypothetical protein